MLAETGSAPGQRATSVSIRQQIYTQLPPLVVVSSDHVLKDSFKLFADRASGHDTIQLTFQDNWLTVGNAMETVKNTSLNGTFEYDRSVINAISQYRKDVQEGRHAPLMMLIGIPANMPQVYAPLNLDVAGENAFPSDQRRPVVRGTSRIQGSHQAKAAPSASNLDRKLPKNVGPGDRQAPLSSALYGKAPSPLRESVDWSPIQNRNSSEPLMDASASTNARRAEGFSYNPNSCSGTERFAPLFAELRLEDIKGIAKGVLTSLAEEDQAELVRDLKQIQTRLRNFKAAVRNQNRSSMTECEGLLRQCVLRFLGGCEKADLLGLQRRNVFIPNLTEFAEWDYFQAFATATIDLHDHLEKARLTTRPLFAPSESGNTLLQMEMEPQPRTTQ